MTDTMHGADIPITEHRNREAGIVISEAYLESESETCVIFMIVPLSTDSDEKKENKNKIPN